MFEKFYPAFVDMTMALGFPAFSIDEKNPLKVVFSEIERGDDVSERFERLRERFMEVLTKDLSRFPFVVSIFFPTNTGAPLYSKRINILIGQGVQRGVAEIHINIPRTGRSLNVVISDSWIHIETIDENYQVISFERPENAVEYIRNFVVEQVQSMSASSKKEVAVA